MYVTFSYENGKKNGYKCSYTPSPKDSAIGLLAAKENYRNDTLQGLSYYYKAGKLSRMVNYKDGLLEGRALDFSPDSLITMITIYKGGFIKKLIKINQYNSASHKEGLWQTFYANGNVKDEGTYQDGKKDGYFRWYSYMGSQDSIKKYINDIEQTNAPELAKLDIVTKYYPNGVVKSTGPVKNGQYFGTHNEYSETGAIVKSEIYDSGRIMAEGVLDTAGLQQGEWKEYHENGQLKSIGKYMNGIKVGEWKYFYSNKQMFETGKYDNQGREQGKWIWYFDNGKIRRESNFYNGQEDGDFVEYADSGGIATQGQYLEGLKQGKWTYNMGNYSDVGNYKDDERDSVWVEYYNDNHKIRFEGNYNAGRPDGKHTWYYPDGKKEIEGEYTMGVMQDKWKYYGRDGNLFLVVTYKDDVEIRWDAVKVEP